MNDVRNTCASVIRNTFAKFRAKFLMSLVRTFLSYLPTSSDRSDNFTCHCPNNSSAGIVHTKIFDLDHVTTPAFTRTILADKKMCTVEHERNCTVHNTRRTFTNVDKHVVILECRPKHYQTSEYKLVD